MTRYICIHGHFYQPPRENPWLETVEKQDSASPYHDWNEKVTAEAYPPNANSRILDEEGRIKDIVNNYSKLSFNFGPTLLRWLESTRPGLYLSILQADRDSIERFGGHGSALAQPYNHMILPLASDKDKHTQVEWGVEDFLKRFNREPEGMWLPETAVDMESLKVMAEFGIQFTLLAPHQLESLLIDDGPGHEISAPEELDTTRPYEIHLPDGNSINVFPYDAELSNAIAFEGLLEDGERLARRLMDSFPEESDHSPLLHVATDGETYGHHHRHGDMALAYALKEIETSDSVLLTNYGQYLEEHRPEMEAEIRERTSWSCAHGVERWKSDCGCSTGGEPEWNQEWRKPLREGLDRLRKDLDPLYEKAAGHYFEDPWEARDRYVKVILDRSEENLEKYFERQSSRELSEADKSTALKLLELQRHLMLMYTSCGWFFADISDIGTVQILRYADRAIQLGEELFEVELLDPLLEELEKARSNRDRFNTGRDVYEYFVSPARVDMKRVAAHYAILSLFESFEREKEVYSYKIRLEAEKLRVEELGDTKLALGGIEVSSRITKGSRSYEFGVIYFGEQNLSAGVRMSGEGQGLENVAQTVFDSFQQGNLTEAHQELNDGFGSLNYSLSTLFRDDQRRVLNDILEDRLKGVKEQYRMMYDDHLPLMRYLVEHEVSLPYVLHNTAEFTLNADLRSALSGPKLELESAEDIMQQMNKLGVDVQDGYLEYIIRSRLKEFSLEIRDNPRMADTLESLKQLLDFVASLPFEVEMRDLQTSYYGASRAIRKDLGALMEEDKESVPRWANLFLELGNEIGVRVDV